jgi:Lon protease-like protein
MQRETFTPPELTDALLARMPLFPLQRTVLFPGAVLPLHFFEPRYRALAAYAVDGPRVLALGTLQEPPEDDGPEDEAAEGAPPIHRVVTLGAVAAHRRLPDGRWDIALRGLCRAEVVAEVPSGEPFRLLQVRRLRERDRPDDARLAFELRSAAVQLANLVPALWSQLNPHLLEARTPAALADTMAALFLDDADARRALIDEVRVGVRLERVTEAIASHLLDLVVRSSERGAERVLH